MNKKQIFWSIIKQLFLIVWKLLMMAVLIISRIISFILDIIITKLEEYLSVKHKKL